MSRTNRMFINNVDDCVDEMLESVAMQHPGLQKLKGHRVIIREDVKQFCEGGHVSIISGGGSGHEPFAAGFVGRGMLTAAVAGSVFASPPPADIIAAIEASKSSGGTLLVVANYTGDRLNFGIALERAKSLGHNVKMVVVGEDCALESTDKTAGRRGLVGIVNVMKIAGAMSEERKSLEEILNVTKDVAANMGTIGVSLTGCSIPGSGSSFQLHESEMELGLGAHGEAGVKRMKILSADDTVITMIQHMTNPKNASFLELPAASKVAVTMNNLGGLSAVEMHILARKVMKELKKLNVIVERFYLGHFMTSLDMSGFNLNVTKLTNSILLCLDADTNAPGWPRISVSTKTNYSHNNDFLMDSLPTSQASNIPAHVSSKNSFIITEFFLNGLKSACEAIILKEACLNNLDSASGDGDCGSTLKRGALMILSKLKDFNGLSLSDVFLHIAASAEVSMGGASGGLYSLFFTAASLHAADRSLTTWKKCVDGGMNSIIEYGKAEPGDRTMVDALSALGLSLKHSIDGNKTLTEAVSKAAIDVTAAAEKTTFMKAKAGRASYVAKEHLKQPDPGAMAVAFLVQAISSYLLKTSTSC